MCVLVIFCKFIYGIFTAKNADFYLKIGKFYDELSGNEILEDLLNWK